MILSLLFLGVLAWGCAAVSDQGAEKSSSITPVPAGPNLTLSPPVVEYKRKVKVLVAGSGFQPKQEVGLWIQTEGAVTDISYLVNPPAVANRYGAFASVWEIDNEIRRKLLKPTVYTLKAVDRNGKTLDSVPVVFCDAKAKDKAPPCVMIQMDEKAKKK